MAQFILPALTGPAKYQRYSVEFAAWDRAGQHREGSTVKVRTSLTEDTNAARLQALRIAETAVRSQRLLPFEGFLGASFTLS